MPSATGTKRVRVSATQSQDKGFKIDLRVTRVSQFFDHSVCPLFADVAKQM